ncbi:MAG: GtrA family protein [Acidimicrobiia bacterium]
MKRYLKSFVNRESLNQAIKVGIVGVFNTVVSFSLFNVFRVMGASPQWSLATSFALTTFMSYLINRRWTFALKDGKVSGRETASFFGVNVVAYAVSAGFMALAQNWFGPLSRLGENFVLLVAAGLLILPKLAGYRDIVFGKALEEKAEVPSAG